MKAHLVAAIGFTFCVASGTSILGEAREGASEAPARYFQVQRDERPCNLTICSEYVLTELGGDGHEQRASRLDFAAAHLDDGIVATALAAPPGDLVVYGAIRRTIDEGAVLGVERAYRGMPGGRVGPAARFFVVGEAGDVLAPPGSLVARPIGGEEGVPIASVSLSALEGFRMQTSWLERRMALGAAVVAGHLSGEDAAKVLEVDQVFDLLPDRGGPCPLLLHTCPGGETPIYTRADNRCLVFQGCAGPRVCPDFLPVPCEAGYRMIRWATPDPACWSQVCDPSFLTE